MYKKNVSKNDRRCVLLHVQSIQEGAYIERVGWSGSASLLNDISLECTLNDVLRVQLARRAADVFVSSVRHNSHLAAPSYWHFAYTSFTSSLRALICYHCECRPSIAECRPGHVPVRRSFALHFCRGVVQCGVSHASDISRILGIVTRARRVSWVDFNVARGHGRPIL